MNIEPSTTTDESQQESLRDIATAAFKEASGEPVEAKLPTVEEVAAFELPSYTKAWPEAARNGLKAFAEAKHHRAHLDPILKQIEESNKYVTQRDQEYAAYKKSFDPVAEILKPLEAQYHLQGMDLRTGVAQLVEGAKFVASDPDQAFPYFAGQYRPRDPASAVMGIAKAWGVDLGQVTQEQPWVDPTYQALISPLQKQIAELSEFRGQFEQQRQQQEWQARQQHQEAFVAKVASLEEAKDESGNLKYPHLNDRVWSSIEMIASRGLVDVQAPDAFDQAYAKALLLDPELSQSVIADRAKAAEAKAIQEATARSSAAQKEAQSNRSIAGKGHRAERGKPMTTREAATAAMRQLTQ